MRAHRSRSSRSDPEWPVDDSGWLVAQQVGPRQGPDRLTGWLPQGTPPPATRVVTREPDELDVFLASQGLDGLADVDAWGRELPDEPPPSWFARLAPPWRAAVSACIVLAVLVAGFAGYRLLVRPDDRVPTLPAGAEAVPTSAPSAALPPAETSAGGDGGQPGQAAPPTASPTATTLLVHVVGRVARPGVVTLRPGDRVADAVAAAGGALEDADLGRMNLARSVSDGEQVMVPAPGEQVPAAVQGPEPAAAGAGSTGDNTAPQGRPVNLNTADASTLDTLPGVGPVLSQRIIEHREQVGRFSSVEELLDVSGIGEKLLEKIRPQVVV